MHEQEQFLQVLDRDEAERRFREAIDLMPRGIETVPLDAALGRVLAADVISPVDVPSFDRSNVDGFAVVAENTFGASEEAPRSVQLGEEAIHTGVVPRTVIRTGTAVSIATGGMVPRGADAVVMVEHAEIDGRDLRIARAVTAGTGVSFAGTDITAGETVLRRGQLLTSRDTGVLAAIGVAGVEVWRKPIVAILSTGDEIIAPGEPMHPAKVYDSNAQVLADAVRELGGEPRRLGITHDDLAALREKLHHALECADIVMLSGGTSKGAGDLSYRVVAELREPGIVAHGVALKPGKPICLAATRGRPVVVLPGFPTSAIFTFHEFVAPVIRLLAGRGSEERTSVPARLAVKVNSEIGRTEYLLVGLVETTDEAAGTSLAAYPMGQGSGSVTTFSRADGFATIGRHQEIVQAGTLVEVQLLGRELQLADLVVIGSHCIGLDYLLGQLQERGVRSKFLAVGSTAGLDAARRGECDVAGIHLLDPKTDQVQSTVSHAGAGPCRRLRPGAGRRLPSGRQAVRRPDCARCHCRGEKRSVMPDGQSQPGQRHPSADRSSPRRRQAGRLRGATPESQRRGRRRLARPSGLGSDAGHDCRQRRARIPAGAGRTLRFRGTEIAGESSGRDGLQEAAGGAVHARRAGAPRDEALAPPVRGWPV